MKQQEIREHLEVMLKKVNKPGQYIGGEFNQVVKDENLADVRFAFAFPDLYEIGMSYVGLQILYNLLNKEENVYCERVFAPASDMENLLRENQVPLFTLETKSDIKDFDFFGFTLQYEMSFTNILNMIDLAQIPLEAKDRDDSYPLLVAGGPCAYNPEPLTDFFDLFMIGDGENQIREVAQIMADVKREIAEATAAGKPLPFASRKQEVLKRASKVDGVYVPSFYEVAYNEDGTVAEFRKLYSEAPLPVRRAFISDLMEVEYPTEPLVPLIETAQDRAVVETFRGCTRGCRFCQAGMIYRPVRERTAERVTELAKKQLDSTGHEELSLLSLSTSDHSQFRDMALGLMSMCSKEDVSLSLPSLRLDSFSFDVLEQIQKYKKSGLTFAPEAGTQRMRDVINKNITEEDIFSAVRQAIELGWQKVKLYFMMGLPGETFEDLEGIANIAKKIMDINFDMKGRAGGRFNITVSVSNFVPKPFTPFQWVAQDEDFFEKHDFLSRKLKIRGVSFNYHDSPVSTLEAVFARGDRRTGKLLKRAFELGCKFDSWSENFDWEKWQQAIEDTGIDIHFYTTRQRELAEVLPWDIIDCGVSKKFLISEYEKAMAQTTTPDCRIHCNHCGINRYTPCEWEGIHG